MSIAAEAGSVISHSHGLFTCFCGCGPALSAPCILLRSIKQNVWSALLSRSDLYVWSLLVVGYIMKVSIVQTLERSTTTAGGTLSKIWRNPLTISGGTLSKICKIFPTISGASSGKIPQESLEEPSATSAKIPQHYLEEPSATTARIPQHSLEEASATSTRIPQQPL